MKAKKEQEKPEVICRYADGTPCPPDGAYIPDDIAEKLVQEVNRIFYGGRVVNENIRAS